MQILNQTIQNTKKNIKTQANLGRVISELTKKFGSFRGLM
jgi:hypothetical protein